MNIESKLWHVRSAIGGGVEITQKASRVTRFSYSFPSAVSLARMSESKFNATCRESFHNQPARKGI